MAAAGAITIIELIFNISNKVKLPWWGWLLVPSVILLIILALAGYDLKHPKNMNWIEDYYLTENPDRKVEGWSSPCIFLDGCII
jgi:hypothetical protein